MTEAPIILFDGVCNFCDSTVNFVIRKNKAAQIRFATLQSETGQRLLAQYKLSTISLDSFIFIEDGKAFSRSTGALRVCRYFPGAWPVFYGFIIVPLPIRNYIYNVIARNRYKWFGQKETCMVPGPSIRQRFL
ncbi:MAG: thiol-disulfide oxidoreductase DCC family protein [Ferruginibacter sp.]|nr:thiol-disulfide oxidoreductase DCC family protein [Ferruginibacter sp.]